ncbi:hypothetical protein FUAX_06810 [Fulvitalea axinellae]|uniref:Uncharacterized protein n=1 Tax=Fulvitalea axinellae TaxID=1182444 RepID=A0AAU9C8E1_9BACT|nr:hypothetical protein FUAX_06810 [Fulvitalea axinellae]
MFRHSPPRKKKEAQKREGAAKMPPQAMREEEGLKPDLRIISDIKFPMQGMQGTVFFFRDGAGREMVAKLCEQEGALQREHFGATFIRNMHSERVGAPESELHRTGDETFTALKAALAEWTEEENAAMAFGAMAEYKGSHLLLMEKMAGVPYYPIPEEFGGNRTVLDSLADENTGLALGEVAFYDLLLGNIDRIIASLNPYNMLYQAPEAGKAMRINAIDSAFSVFGQKFGIDRFAPELVGERARRIQDFSRSFSVRSGDVDDQDWEMVEYGAPHSDRQFDAKKDKDRLEELLQASTTDRDKHRELSRYAENILEKMLEPAVQEILTITLVGDPGNSRLARSVATQFEKVCQANVPRHLLDLGAVKGYMTLVKRLKDPEFTDKLVTMTSGGMGREASGLLRNLYQVSSPYLESASYSVLEKKVEQVQKKFLKRKK